jgi:hypothetical protein
MTLDERLERMAQAAEEHAELRRKQCLEAAEKDLQSTFCAYMASSITLRSLASILRAGIERADLLNQEKPHV